MASSFPKSAPITFLLIHGAWHYGHSWDGVRKHLEAAGHTVHSPSVAFEDANGKPYHTLDEVVKGLLNYVEEKALNDFVLVGHSWGGIIITDMAVKLPEGKIKRLVYYSAFVPLEGEGLFDCVPPLARTLYGGLADQHPDRLFPCPYPLFRDAFIGDADAEQAAEVYKSLRLQPYGTWDDGVKNTESFHSFPPKIPRSYLLADADCSAPPGVYEGNAAKLGFFRKVLVHGSHEVMFTNPEALAKAIVTAGRD
ncbi:hypothetical protein Dda_1609 [Drechslerella dactyloides]|uniref:AB hydrolase-1 domain-containing protein n=1 Tax=Drechslerella dactyloides TaxID=74499 RepID=A0AAD6NM87_DREDA|nr:hypothetical protein Dda_1609 [Drechslerella dactyloides]